MHDALIFAAGIAVGYVASLIREFLRKRAVRIHRQEAKKRYRQFEQDSKDFRQDAIRQDRKSD